MVSVFARVVQGPRVYSFFSLTPFFSFHDNFFCFGYNSGNFLPPEAGTNK